MNKRASMLSRMADKLLKSADKSDAYAQSKAKEEKFKKLHEYMTDRYKFYLSTNNKQDYLDQVKKDIDEVKRLEKKLTLTTTEADTLNRLFAKYKIDY